MNRLSNLNASSPACLNRRSALKLLGGVSLAATTQFIPSFAIAAEPKRGGTIKIGVSGGSTSDSLDPTTYLDSHMYVIGFALGNNLVEIGPDRKPIPELAESWQSSDGAKHWEFKLRKGVTFHNGRPLTAADVVYSLNRHIGEDSKSAAKGFLNGVSSIHTEGDRVIIDHESGDADIPIIMGDFHLQIIPEGHTDWTTFVGTGPYILEEFEPGVSFKASRNPNYWKEDRAWVDSVEVLYITDATARTSALLSGGVDIIDRVDNKTVKRLQDLNRYNLIEGLGGRYETTVMDVRNSPFNDANVRLALKYAVNRQEIVDRIFQGFAALGNDHPIPPADPFYHSELPQRPYDTDKAAWHLKQTGLDSLTLDLSAADAAFPGAVDAAVLMKESARTAGIEINVRQEPNDGYWSNVWMKKPYVMSNWSTRPTPGMMFSVAFACGAPWAEAYWCNNQFEKLMTAGKTETDFVRRKQIYWDMQEIIHNDGGNGIFAFPSDLDAYDRSIQGTIADGVNRLMGARVIERVWKA